MKFITKTKEKIVEQYQTDATINTVKRLTGPTINAIPRVAAEYISEKLPVAHWLPHYDYRWFFTDFVAGISIGVLFIPQGLAYAKVATIPIANGLYASWLPSALYFFLGTSKELSTGPTSILALLTSQAVAALSTEGYAPADIASAMAFMVGSFALILGVCKLGFILDFISSAVLSGWISAVAITIGLGQVGSLIGVSAGTGVAHQIHYILTHLGDIQGLTICLGLTGILMLWILEFIGKKWGKTNLWLKAVGTSRTVIVMVIYTLISWGVNRHRDVTDYKWAVTEVATNGIPKPVGHDSTLLSKVIPHCAAPLIAMSVEHLGVGKAFALKNDYVLDKSQELVFLGTENMVNSLFGALTTGGAMSRTAVNSDCGVRSPMNFLFTSALIILTLFELAPALYWVPSATLAAIIIMAVARLVSTPDVFYRYWRMSFIDFIASQIGLWVTLFTSTETGLYASVGFSVGYTLLRLAFPHLIQVTHLDTENNHWSLPKNRIVDNELDVPPETFLVRYTEDLLFPNATRIKTRVIDSIKVHYEPANNPARDVKSVNRTWSKASMRKIEATRKRKNITPYEGEITPLRHIVLDFGMCGFIDSTGIFSLLELKMELRRYIGKDLQFRFVNMSKYVRERFDRSDWEFALEGEPRTGHADVIFNSLEVALLHRDGEEKDEILQEEKALEV